MTFNRNLIFLVVALVCFAVALLLDLNVLHGGHHAAWVDGGLLAFAGAHLP